MPQCRFSFTSPASCRFSGVAPLKFPTGRKLSAALRQYAGPLTFVQSRSNCLPLTRGNASITTNRHTLSCSRLDSTMPTAANATKLGNKRKLLDDSDSDSEDGGAALSNGFKVDEEFARRLEHNKKREERQRCMLDSFSINAPVFLQI